MLSYQTIILGFFLYTTLTGCATIINGSTEPYQVTSEPNGAQVLLSTGESCITPCIIEKKRKSTFKVNIEKKGYKPQEIMVTNHTSQGGSVAMVGNLMMLGSIMWIGIDTISGATQELSPNPCMFVLEPAQNTSGI